MAASLESIASEISSDAQVTDVCEFKLVPSLKEKYKFVKVNLNNFSGAPPPLSGPTSSQLLEFKVPVRVYNLSRSILEWTNDITPTASRSTATFEDVFDLGNNITFGSAGGVNIVDLPHAQNYSKIVRPLETPLDELLQNDMDSGLYKSNQPAIGFTPSITLIPGSNIIPGGYNKLGVVQYGPGDSYIEQAHCEVTAISANNTVLRRYPLGAFKGTLFGVDRDFYSPVEQYLRISAGIADKMAFTSLYNPLNALNVGTNDPSMSANSPGAMQLRNVTLWLAVEQNEFIAKNIVNKYMNGKLQYSIPYTTGFKNGGANAGNQTTISLNLNPMYGKRLKRITHSVFNSSEKGNTAYDNANYNGEKIATYQTVLDTYPIQDRVLSCRLAAAGGAMNMDDWMENKRFIPKRSCISSQQAYSTNWFHRDQWFEPHDPEKSLPDVNLDEGLLMDTPKQWVFTGVASTSGLLHYTYAEFSREILITNDGPVFVTTGAI